MQNQASSHLVDQRERLLECVDTSQRGVAQLGACTMAQRWFDGCRRWHDVGWIGLMVMVLVLEMVVDLS